MLLNFPKENFILPVSKNLIMFEKKRKGLAVLSKFKFFILYSFVQQIIINKNHKVLKMHSNYLLNKNQHCVSKETTKITQFIFLANHKQK